MCSIVQDLPKYLGCADQSSGILYIFYSTEWIYRFGWGSGSGKSTVAKMVAGLISATDGRIDGTLPTKSNWLTRRKASPVQMIFQNPFGALNPTRTVRQHLEHVSMGGVSETDMIPILEQVGLEAHNYACQIST